MPDGKLQTEVLQSITRGVNTLLDPLLLPQGQAARLHNVEVRNGLAESSAKLVGVELPVQGVFQGAFAYELEWELRWVVVISGAVWVYNAVTGEWGHKHAFPTKEFDQAYFCQVGKHCIVQNGIYEPEENWPLILHEDEVVDNLEVEYIYGNDIVKVKDYVTEWPSGATHDYDTIRVPIGKAMAFGQGRLFVAVERYYDNGLATGELAGWRSGEGLRFILASDDERADDPRRMLVFRETDLLAGGGAITLPAENGFITSMSCFHNAATGTGLGELVVMCRRGSAAFAVSVPRFNAGDVSNQWFSSGFGQQLFQSSGSYSPWAMVPVNADLVYYGEDGLRTIKYTATSEGSSGGVASLPISPELHTYVARTAQAHLPYVSAVNTDNYVFCTANGQELADGSVAFKDVLLWDLANFQASGESPQRVFAGAWRGVFVHCVLKYFGNVPGVIYRETSTGVLKLGVYPRAAHDPDKTSVVRSAAYVFNAPANLKRLKHVDLLFDNVTTDLSVRVRWRVDCGHYWHVSDTRAFKSTGSYSTGMFRVPVESDNAGTGHIFEFAVEWIGHARLKLCLFNAVVLDTFAGDEEGMCETSDLATRETAPAGGGAEAPEE